MKIRFANFIGLSLIFFSLLTHAETLNPVSPQIIRELYTPQLNTIAGNAKGKVILVELFDYNCPYCRQVNPIINKLIAKNPDLRVVFKEYLLFGQPSELATKAALAATKQNKYLVFRNALMSATQPLTYPEIMRIAAKTDLNTKALSKAMNSSQIQQQIIKNTALPEILGVQGAPTFIISNSKILQTPTDKTIKQYVFNGSENAEENLQKLIDIARKG